MTNSGGRKPDAARREAAAAWLVRTQSDQASEADWLAFEQWLGDPANRAAMDAVEEAVADIDANAGAIAAALKRASPGAQPRKATAPARSRFAWWASGVGLAAAAGLALLIVPPLLAPVPRATPEITLAYSAPANEVLPVTLPDGSVATLNRGASLRLRWETAERHVDVIQGEVAFSVRHDVARPFVVAAGGATIRDVGTEFNVGHNADGLSVTVREGAVDVSAPGISSTRVDAGHALRFDAGRGEARLSRVNADDAFAWREGRMIFRDVTLAEVVQDMNRYATAPIRIDDAAASTLRFSGVIMIESARKMADQLQAFLPVSATEAGGEIVIRSR